MCAPTGELQLDEALQPHELRLLIHPSYALFEAEEPDIRSHEFRCCCNCCSCRAGAVVIGALEVLYLVYQLGYAAALWLKGGSSHLSHLAVTVVAAAAAVAAVALAFAGLITGKKALLVPHLLAQAIAILIFVTAAVLCFVALMGGPQSVLSVLSISKTDQELFMASRSLVQEKLGTEELTRRRSFEDLRPLVIFKFMLNFTMSVLEAWWLVVFLRCWRFLKAKQAFKEVQKGQQGLIGSRMANATAILPATNQYYYSANKADLPLALRRNPPATASPRPNVF